MFLMGSCWAVCRLKLALSKWKRCISLACALFRWIPSHFQEHVAEALRVGGKRQCLSGYESGM